MADDRFETKKERDARISEQKHKDAIRERGRQKRMKEDPEKERDKRKREGNP